MNGGSKPLILLTLYDLYFHHDGRKIMKLDSSYVNFGLVDDDSDNFAHIPSPRRPVPLVSPIR